jgi:hypothetical protein
MNHEKIIVLLTQGRFRITDHATVYLFDDLSEAEDFCSKNTNGKTTVWVKAQIVNHAVSVELVNADEDLGSPKRSSNWNQRFPRNFD